MLGRDMETKGGGCMMRGRRRRVKMKSEDSFVYVLKGGGFLWLCNDEGKRNSQPVNSQQDILMDAEKASSVILWVVSV
jgi:hypothetical protein